MLRKPIRLPLVLLFAGSTVFAREWMGVKRPERALPAPGDSATMTATSPSEPKPRPKTDTSWLSRKVQSIPVGSPGIFLGMLEGVRCFNCEPGIVHLNLSDSLSREAGFLSLRLDIWNKIERPLRDRRMYDYANLCFFFGYKAVDTTWVVGERAEIRIQEVPCYPYLQRRLTAPSPTGAPLPVPIPLHAPVPPGTGRESGSQGPDSAAPAAPVPSPAPARAVDSTRTRVLEAPKAP